MAERSWRRPGAGTGRPRARFSALPHILARTPAPVRVIAGTVVLVLGILIVARPLTSLLLLGLYVGVSAIVSGVFDLVSTRASPRWWNRIFAALWIVGGAAVIVWLGRSLEALPTVLSVLLLVGGLASIGDAALGGTVSQRVLAAAWGGAQVAFGVLSLTWPDVTVLVVAVVFGVRTIVFGGASIVQGLRALLRQSREVAAEPDVAATRSRAHRRRAWAATGRYALVVLLVVVSAGGWVVNDLLADGAPVVDSFYTPPATVPAEHGRLIRSDDFLGQAPEGGSVRRILYTTRDALDRPAVSSGIVIVPDDPPPGARPVVSWNHGTTGVARGCAPSLRDAAATRWEIPGMDDAMARGWVVVASDYSGQGAPGVFPYLIGVGEARSSLDAILAARELEARARDSWVELGSDVAVWGHSQGGHAALWTAQIAAGYAPQLTIVGTAAASPVTDPRALARELTRGGATAELSVLTSWVLVPYAQTYPDIDLDEYVTPAARSLVREMTQRCLDEPGVVVSMISALGVSGDRPIYSAGLIGGVLGDRLADNAAVGPFPSPLLVAWGSADEVIPPALQSDFVAAQCAAGQPIQGLEYAGYEHIHTIYPGSKFTPVLLRWTADRFAGLPAPPDVCPQ